jgi:hypothetical protein
MSSVCIEPVAVFLIWMESPTSYWICSLSFTTRPCFEAEISPTSYWICSLSFTTRPCFEAEISALPQVSGPRLFFLCCLVLSQPLIWRHIFPVLQQVANSDFLFLLRLHFLAELTDPVS